MSVLSGQGAGTHPGRSSAWPLAADRGMATNHMEVDDDGQQYKSEWTAQKGC